jgi:hypothetical protein
MHGSGLISTCLACLIILVLNLSSLQKLAPLKKRQASLEKRGAGIHKRLFSEEIECRDVNFSGMIMIKSQDVLL